MTCGPMLGLLQETMEFTILPSTLSLASSGPYANAVAQGSPSAPYRPLSGPETCLLRPPLQILASLIGTATWNTCRIHVIYVDVENSTWNMCWFYVENWSSGVQILWTSNSRRFNVDMKSWLCSPYDCKELYVYQKVVRWLVWGQCGGKWNVLTSGIYEESSVVIKACLVR